MTRRAGTPRASCRPRRSRCPPRLTSSGSSSNWPAPEPARPATALNLTGRETQLRVLFPTWAFSGHLNPMVPLGWALRAGGHETLVASHPSFAPVIARAGLPALPVGPEFDLDAEVRAETIAGRWDDDLTAEEIRDRHRDLVGLQAPRRSAEVMADDLVAFARYWRPDLVVFEPTSFVGPLVARLLGIPAVRHLWTADFTAPVNGFGPTVSSLPARVGLGGLGG